MEENPHVDSVNRSATRFWFHLRRQAGDGLMLVRLQAISVAARTVSLLITSLILSVGLLFFLLILCVAFALWLGALLDSYALATLATALLWALLLAGVYVLRHRIITAPLVRRFSSIIPTLQAPSGNESDATPHNLGDLRRQRAQIEDALAAGNSQLKLDIQELYLAIQIWLWRLTVVRIVTRLASSLRSLFTRH